MPGQDTLGVHKPDSQAPHVPALPELPELPERNVTESLEERIQREKQERYEQSEEYKQLQASKKADAENIALAVLGASSQVSDADLDQLKAEGQARPPS